VYPKRVTNVTQMGYSVGVGSGVAFTGIAPGRIIELVPAKTQTSLRLSNAVLDELQRLAEKLDKPRADVIELAVSHLSGTLAHDQPVYIGPPPDDPKSHKKARRVA
jgi:hypothetical protein